MTFNPIASDHPPPTTVDAGDALQGVACPTTSQCTAVDNQGQQVTFNPDTPGNPIPTKPSFDSFFAVVCPSANQCTGVGNPTSNVVTFNPTAPENTIIVPHDPSNGLDAVACPSPTQCTAVDLLGQEVTFNPTTPDSPTPTTIDTGGWLEGVACPSTSQCTAVDSRGLQVTFNPTAPGNPTPTAIATGDWLWGLACPSLTQCTAVGDSVEVTFNPTEPGSQTPIPIDVANSKAAVACPSTSQCTAVAGSEEVTFDPAEPLKPAEPLEPADPLKPGGGEITVGSPLHAVGCPSAGQCTALDDAVVELTVAGQRIIVTTPSAHACIAPGKQLGVTLSSASIGHSGGAELTFLTAAFYLDEGVRHAYKKTKRTEAGQRTTVIVTTYSTNATARHLPVTVAPLVAGLKRGIHTLTIKLHYKGARHEHGHRRRLTITRTLTTKFSVC